MSRTVLIAGCGYVGNALARRLMARGDAVWGLRRDARALLEGVRPITADLTEPESLGDLPDTVSAVVYAASPDGRREAAYRKAYVSGPTNLLRALGEAGARPERFVFVSSTRVYGESDGARVDEGTLPDPASWRGQTLLEAEAAVRKSAPGAVILRLGGIYGPGRVRIVERVRAGTAVCPPDTVYSNRIHREDCAGAIEHLLGIPDPRPLYLGVDREPAPLCTVYRWLARMIGAEEPPRAERWEGPRRASKRCSSRRLVESGYEFRYPSYREGYGQLLGEAP